MDYWVSEVGAHWGSNPSQCDLPVTFHIKHYNVLLVLWAGVISVTFTQNTQDFTQSRVNQKHHENALSMTKAGGKWPDWP